MDFETTHALIAACIGAAAVLLLVIGSAVLHRRARWKDWLDSTDRADPGRWRNHE